MRTIHVCVIAMIAAVLGSLATLAAQPQLQRSTVFEWATLEAKPTQTGARRDVMRRPTPTLDELEIHITTLNVGQVSHPPHRHPQEELLIVKEGTVETLQNGKPSRLGPGSIIFHSSNDLHNIRNAGTTPATYHVIQWSVPGAALGSALIGGQAQSTLRSTSGQPSVAEFSDGRTLVVFAHQDDDLLWMLPFWPVAEKLLLSVYPAAPMFEELIQSFPPRLNYRARWTPIWNSVDNDIWAEIFTDRCKRAPIITLASVKAHLRPFFAAPIKRVVTHNNWGEYGHAQHRLVNIAVRQLAVETGLDVWSLGTRMPAEAREQSQYVDVAAELGLPTIEGFFDANLFREVRAAYLARIPNASTPELTAKFRAWWPTLWTWSDQPEAFPMGWRPFIKLVDKGVDLTAENRTVSRLQDEVPVANDCLTNPTISKPK